MNPTSPRPGVLLVATPLLTDPNFARSVVLLLSHDPDGTVGVVIDRPTDIAVGEYLPTWELVAAEPAVVFHGGPVQQEVGIGVGIRAGMLELVDLGEDPDPDIPVRIFAGCAGWSPGQLDGELAEDAWFVLPFEPSDLLTDEPYDLWSHVLRRQAAPLAYFGLYPPDPRLN